VFGLDPLESAATLLFLHLLQVALFVCLIRYLDVYEREPFPVVLSMFVWGGLIATFVSLHVGGWLMTQLPSDVATLWGPAIVGPVVEETTKGLALVAVFAGAYVLSRRRRRASEFSGITDGVVYGAAVGFGFAFVENLHYFVTSSALYDTDVGVNVLLLRADFGGAGSFLHALFTACLGAGLGYAAWAHGWLRRTTAVLAGLAAAISLHAVWNGLDTLLLVRRFGADAVRSPGTLPPARRTAFDALFAHYHAYTMGVFYVALVTLLAVFVCWLVYERRIIVDELAAEVGQGLLTEQERRLLASVAGRWRYYLRQVRCGRSVAHLRVLHERLTELAILKRRTRLFGGDPQRIMRTRAEVALLRDYAARLTALQDKESATTSSQGKQTTPTPGSAVQG
jgi:protease PrsW